MQGVCKLCQLESELKKSHFIPKFIVRWVKNTGITGYLREKNKPHKRVQDIAKEYLLCADCEGMFSVWERSFANKVFYPFVGKGESIACYGAWMSKFCASLSWRALTFIRSKHNKEEESEEYNDALDNAELHLRKFLLGEEVDLFQYEQHVFPLQQIKLTAKSGLPPNTNRYFLRIMAMGIVGNSTNLYIYTKLPCFIILGAVKSKELQKAQSSRIALKEGRLSPRRYWWPNEFISYIVSNAKAVTEAHDSIPNSQKAHFDEYIKNNPEKALKSKTFEAFMRDRNQFGDKVFRQ